MPSSVAPAPVLVLAQPRSRAWSPSRPDVPLHPVVSLEEALGGRYGSDAHLQPSVAVGLLERPDGLPEEVLGLAPRAKWGSLDGAALVVSSVALDVDREGHEPWPSGESGEDAREALEALLGAAGPGWGGYTTRGGLRLVARLASPVLLTSREEAHQLTGQIRALLRSLVLPPGLVGDALPWSQLYRLPRVRRDGADLSPVLVLPPVEGVQLPSPSAETPGASRPDPRHALRDADRAHYEALRYSDPPPPDSLPVADVWMVLEGLSATSKAGRIRDLLGEGRALSDQLDPGDRHRTYMGIVRSIAAQVHRGSSVRVIPPRVLWGVVARTVAAELAADPGWSTSWSKAWRMVVDAVEVEAARRGVSVSRPDPRVVYSTGEVAVRDREGGWHVAPRQDAGLVADRLWSTSTYQGRSGTTRLLADHGVPGQIVYAYPGAAREGYDPEADQVVVPTWSRPEVPAERSPAVEIWLDLLLSETRERETVLDWLALAHRLDLPAPCLYLDGRRGAGKGLLSSAVAQLWRGRPVPFDEAAGSFQPGRLEAPVVVYEEAHGLGIREASVFRTLVAEGAARVNRKNRDQLTVLGYPRLLATANNPRGLTLRGRAAADLTVEDREAILARILYVPVSDAAAEYLRGLGGRVGTSGWLVDPETGEPGAVPRHLRWLAETRQASPAPGGRFIVEVDPSEYRWRTTLEDEDAYRVLVALAGALLRGSRGVLLRPPVVLWDPQTIAGAAWPSLAGLAESHHTPRLVEVRRAGRTLAAGRPAVSVDGARWWPADLALVLRAAEEAGLDLVALRAAIEDRPRASSSLTLETACP